MTGLASGDNPIEIRSRDDLRHWLAVNHSDRKGAWLITWKQPSPHYLAIGELIEELLCWGWIDSKSKRVDEHRTSIYISKRNPKSAWSATNKAKIERNRANGRMTAAGEALVTAAKENGMWEFLDDVERLEIPEDLGKALGDDLHAIWVGYPRHVKRSTLEWIKTAKRPDTRAKRIEDVRCSAKQGVRPTPFRD